MPSKAPGNIDPPSEVKHSGFFVLRTPLLPFDEFLDWGAGLSAPAALDDPERLALSLAEDRKALRARLSQIVARPEVLEALYVASPDLEESLDVWRHSPDSGRGRRVERALVRYFSRMTSRATPFGLFAGITAGRIADETRLLLADRPSSRRHTRLDMNYLWTAVGEWALEPSLKRAHTYRPNSSLYRVADRFHYVEERIDNGRRAHYLTAVDSSGLLDTAIEQSRDGVGFAELAEKLAGVDGASPAEAGEFVEELIDNQLLVPDFGPALTGPDPLLGLIEQLEALPEAGGLTSRLKGVAEQLEAIDKVGLGVTPQRYRALVGELDQLTTRPTFGRYFQVDLIKPASQATLGPDFINHVTRGVELLRRLATAPAGPLDDFRARFVERYDRREVPLAQALDEEVGIGFNFGDRNATPQPDAEGLEDPGHRAFETGDAFDAARTSFLMGKVLDAQARGAEEIALDADDLKSLAASEPAPLPAAFAVLALIIRQGGEKDYRVELRNVTGPSGANLLGRFCQAEPELRVLVNEHLRAEERQYADAVLAEVVYLPEERLGNVICRPLLREFEIPYLGRSGAPADRQIPLTDLLISVSGDRIVLRSKRLGREVEPRLTSAHNFYLRRNLAVYRFLCSLQRQKTAQWFGWRWGPLQDLAYLPRVSAGRLILSRARWRVSADELLPLGGAEPAAAFAAFQKWRAARGLPRHAALVDADRVLPFDFDNVLSVEMFLDLLGKQRVATLVELFVSEASELFARGPEGSFRGEIIVPFVNTLPRAGRRAAAPAVAGWDRSFAPGSEWLYMKFYAGPSTVDRLLCALRPLMESPLVRETADSWFFIRYADPHWHLRLRFHGEPARLLAEVLPRVQDVAARSLHAGLVRRIQLDTYEREIERYGGLYGTALAEEIFWADSVGALKIVSTYSGNAGAAARWLLTLRSTDQLLSDFGLQTPAKHEFVCQRLRSLATRGYKSAGFKQHLGQQYRNERKAVEKMMDLPPENAGVYGPGLSAISLTSEALIHSAGRFRALESEGKLTVPVAEILPSLTHMHINRMLKSDLTVQEYVAYDFLRRYYESWAAKQRATP
jgi:thiopeptide-type bacteriocin biosynthesis protein